MHNPTQSLGRRANERYEPRGPWLQLHLDLRQAAEEEPRHKEELGENSTVSTSTLEGWRLRGVPRAEARLVVDEDLPIVEIDVFFLGNRLRGLVGSIGRLARHRASGARREDSRSGLPRCIALDSG